MMWSLFVLERSRRQRIDNDECDRVGRASCYCKSAEPEQGAVLGKLGAEVVYPERNMALRLGKKLLSNNFFGVCFSVQSGRNPSDTGSESFDWKEHRRDRDSPQIPTEYYCY